MALAGACWWEASRENHFSVFLPAIFYMLLILNNLSGKFRYFGSRKADRAISQFRPN
jgi:hypothetical protein